MNNNELYNYIDASNKQNHKNKEADKMLVCFWNEFKTINQYARVHKKTFGYIQAKTIANIGVMPSFLSMCYETPDEYIKAKY